MLSLVPRADRIRHNLNMTPKAKLPSGPRRRQPPPPPTNLQPTTSTAQASLEPFSSWIKVDNAGSNSFADKVHPTVVPDPCQSAQSDSLSPSDLSRHSLPATADGEMVRGAPGETNLDKVQTKLETKLNKVEKRLKTNLNKL